MGVWIIVGLIVVFCIILAALRTPKEKHQALPDEDADHLREQIIRELAQQNLTTRRSKVPEKPAIFTPRPKTVTDKSNGEPTSVDCASITRGLIIDEPWISKILSGEKIWEMRSTNAKVRGPIALIKKRSGTIVGVCSLVDSLGPFDAEALRENEAKHRIPASIYESPGYKWRHAWVLTDARPLAKPVPYRHTSGAVIWVKLDAEAIAALR